MRYVSLSYNHHLVKAEQKRQLRLLQFLTIM